MPAQAKRKTSLTLSASALDEARALGINVSAIAETALERAVAEARQAEWLAENEQAFAEQADWHAQKGHPLADILVSPGASSWKS